MDSEHEENVKHLLFQKGVFCKEEQVFLFMDVIRMYRN